MLKLYVGPLSLFSRKVEIALGEKGIPYEREFVAFTQERGFLPRHPAVLAANPKRQVPVLIDGDLSLYDSTIILEYLDELYPNPPLYPATPQDRARCRLLELDADEILFAPLRQLLFRTERHTTRRGTQPMLRPGARPKC
jgi:glutathione S-transferase